MKGERERERKRNEEVTSTETMARSEIRRAGRMWAVGRYKDEVGRVVMWGKSGRFGVKSAFF